MSEKGPIADCPVPSRKSMKWTFNQIGMTAETLGSRSLLSSALYGLGSRVGK